MENTATRTLINFYGMTDKVTGNIVHRILILNTVEYSINGISNVILSHINSLKRRGNYSIYITQWGEVNITYRQAFEENGVVCFDVPPRKSGILNYIRSLKYILKNNKFDIVHIHGNSGTMAIEAQIAKKYSDAKVIVHLHNSTCSHPLLYGPNSLLAAVMKKNADCLVACSKLAGDWLYKKGYVVLPNAIDIDKFAFNEQARQEIRRRYAISDDEFVLGHVGLFNEQKNHKFLIEVFAEYLKINPKSRLLLVGSGEKVEAIKTQAKLLGVFDKVIFAGTQQDMPAYYSAFDIFVFPSLWEGLGIVNIEAQASGLYGLLSYFVPQDVNIAGKLKYLQLHIADWVCELDSFCKNYQRRVASDANIVAIRQAGYDLCELSDKLLEIYKYKL